MHPPLAKTVARMAHTGMLLSSCDAAIVGVSDPDSSRTAPLAGRANCPVFADYREICAKLKPDFAFMLMRGGGASCMVDRGPGGQRRRGRVDRGGLRDVANRGVTALTPP
jgi:hypothetical protein